MTPTAELRFVERTVTLGPFYVTNNERGEMVPATRTYKVLQQKWQAEYWGFDESGNKFQEEAWRDVPCVKEET
jgi:hypothetical protein